MAKRDGNEGGDAPRNEAKQQPTIGRTLHVNIGTEKEPRWRPAVVVEYWGGKGSVNVQLFTDGDNDFQALHDNGFCKLKSPPAVLWLTSVTEGEATRNWRWPPRS